MNLKTWLSRYKYELLVFLFFVVTRVPDLGHDQFNTDTWRWKARSYNFSSAVFNLKFEQTIQKYHPGVTLMWLGTAAIKVYNLFYDVVFHMSPVNNDIRTVFQLDFVQKFFIVLTIGATLAFVFHALKELFGKKYAVVAVTLLAFEPLYLALTRVFHLEGLLSTFMLASAVWLYYYFHGEPRYYKRRLLISAVFAGLAILTKSSAIYLILFVGLTSLLELKLKKFFVPFLTWLGVTCLTIFVLWPALWVAPVKAVTTVYQGISEVGVEDDHIQYYFGKLVDSPGPEYYFVVLGFRSSIYIILGLLGFAVIAKNYLTRDKKKFALFFGLYCFFYMIQLTLPSKKLDRYVIPELTGLSLITSLFYVWVVEQLSKVINRIGVKNVGFIAAFLLLLVPAFVTVAYLHPDYFSYYNPLLGGLRVGINVIEPKWMIGDREVIAYFQNLKNQRGLADAPKDESFEELISDRKYKNVLSVAFPEKYYTQIWPFFRDINAWAEVASLGQLAKHSKFFVYPVWEDLAKDNTDVKLRYLDTIKVRGTPVYNVYEQI